MAAYATPTAGQGTRTMTVPTVLSSQHVRSTNHTVHTVLPTMSRVPSASVSTSALPSARIGTVSPLGTQTNLGTASPPHGSPLAGTGQQLSGSPAHVMMTSMVPQASVRVTQTVPAKSDQLFDMLDRNHDGVLTADEMAAARTQQVKVTPVAATVPLVMQQPTLISNQVAEQLFESLDRNHDGFLTREEMMPTRQVPTKVTQNGGQVVQTVVIPTTSERAMPLPTDTLQAEINRRMSAEARVHELEGLVLQLRERIIELEGRQNKTVVTKEAPANHHHRAVHIEDVPAVDDPIDRAICEYLEMNPDFPVSIQKVAPNYYVFGDRGTVYVTQRGEHIVVRVGGGFKSLQVFMDERALMVKNADDGPPKDSRDRHRH